MRLIFMGTPDFSVPTLDALVKAGHEIAAVYTQPPRPAGRGKKPRPTPVAARAEALGLPVRTPLNFKDEADRDALAALNADAAIVVAYGLLLPQTILDAPAKGVLQSSCLAPSPVAGGSPDTTGDHGGGCRNGRLCDENGFGS